MHATAKHLHSLGQIRRVWQRDEWLLPAKVLYVFEGYGLPFPPLLCQLIKRRHVLFFGVCETDYEEEIGVQVAVIEGADSVAGACVFAEEDDVGRARLDEQLWLLAALLFVFV